MNQKVDYKCFVPMCTNSKLNSPQKIFYTVPFKDKTRRKLWLQAARQEYSLYSNIYCCSDHFNLKEDMQNYTRYALMGAPTLLKLNVVPHIFNCDPKRIPAHSVKVSTAVEKLERSRLIKEILKEAEEKENTANNFQTPSTKYKNVYQNQQDIQYNNNVLHQNFNNNQNIQCELDTFTSTPAILSSEVNIINENSECEQQVLSFVPINNSENLQKRKNPFFKESAVTLKKFCKEKENTHLSNNQVFSVISVNSNNTLKRKKTVIADLPKKHFRSKSIMCKPQTKNVMCEAKPLMIHRASSPIDLKKDITNNTKFITPSTSIKITSKESSSDSATMTSSKTSSSSHSEYQPTPEEVSEEHEQRDLQMKRQCLAVTNYNINRDPKFYIGIPPDWFWLIENLSEVCDMTSDQIKLILMKVRLNDQFKMLGHQFGLCSSAASRIFNRHVKRVSCYLRTFIITPSLDSLKKNLPIPFRINYNSIVGILDCFEIEIEKPTDPEHQALSWSDYKKCNTIKFMNCISPDGLIIFISKGYGGRISDMELFKDSKIMSVLPENSSIMADRGFKGIDSVLQNKKIQLARPPSVSSNNKLSKEEAILTKRIASLRIHVERVIRRYREFALLQPHSTVDHYNIFHMDEVMYIATALVNLQAPVIRM